MLRPVVSVAATLMVAVALGGLMTGCAQHSRSAGTSETAYGQDAASGQQTLTLKRHTDLVNGVAFSPDGKRLASASFDQTVKVWNVLTGQESSR